MKYLTTIPFTVLKETDEYVVIRWNDPSIHYGKEAFVPRHVYNEYLEWKIENEQTK